MKKNTQSDEPDVNSASYTMLRKGCHHIFFTNKHDAAMTCIDNSLRINPLWARAWYTKGFVLMYQGKLEQALKCYNKALKLSPKFGVVWAHKSGVLKKLGRHKEAKHCQRKLSHLSSGQ